MKKKSTTEQLVWDLSALFKNDNDPEIAKRRKEIEKKTSAFVTKWRERTDYVEKPSVMLEALKEYEEWVRYYGYGGAEAYYFSMRMEQDQSNAALKGKYQKMMDFEKNQMNQIRFFELNIAKIPAEKQQKLLDSPKLAPYRHFLQTNFNSARFLLSDREEMISSMMSSTSYGNWVQMLEGFISKEEREVLGEDGKKKTEHFAGIMSLLKHPKKKIRDTAAKALNDIFNKHSDVAEAEINSVISHKKTSDTIRNVPRPDMTRHLADDMETEVVDLIVASVTKRFDISKRFYVLKAKLLKLPKLAYHERMLEYGAINKAYSWEDSFALVKKVFTDLHPSFAEIMEMFAKNGQFDVFPRKGKSNGAFCAHYLASQPTYILLNHTNKLYDVLTLAHELGHGINNELIRGRQHALYFGTPTSTAEVASTFMEDFVLEELMKEADPELELTLRVMKIDQEIATIFRQIACYRFEQELHAQVREHGYVSKAEIGKLFQKHMSAYMGKAVEQSEGSENWWIYWSHIRNFFYVYTYASGLLISKNLQTQVRKDKQNIEKVVEFLGAGLSDSPKELFSRMHIDISSPAFWEESLEAIDTELKATEALAKKLGKL